MDDNELKELGAATEEGEAPPVMILQAGSPNSLSLDIVEAMRMPGLPPLFLDENGDWDTPADAAFWSQLFSGRVPTPREALALKTELETLQLEAVNSRRAEYLEIAKSLGGGFDDDIRAAYRAECKRRGLQPWEP